MKFFEVTIPLVYHTGGFNAMIPIMKIGRSRDRLIFIIGIPVTESRDGSQAFSS